MPSPDAAASFIAHWSGATLGERSTAGGFLRDLCDLLEVDRPANDDPAYAFERPVSIYHPATGKSTPGFIDLYKRDCFVLEAKKYQAAAPAQPDFALQLVAAQQKKSGIRRDTEAWDAAMLRARAQAENYARNLSADEEPPVFLVVVDVGHSIELYADFTQKGKAYLPFPDPRTHRLRLADLAKPELRARLHAVWTDPASLDPAKKAAAVTREVAGHLAELAKLFEQKHEPAAVAAFLSRCLFCMFAEDIELLPKNSFAELLDSVKGDPGAAVPLLKQLFAEMNTGGFSNIIRKTLLRFNGGLFADPAVLPLDGLQLGLLRAAAKLEWRHVEPAIFGTLLERALDPAERHKLGAHYTPRAYVERLVLPTVIEPLRDQWTHVRTAAVAAATRGDLKTAIKETRTFHHQLCTLRVLDPACGSGNFLYVTLEHLKRLEGEVLELAESFGENMRLDLIGETVDPHQFLGIEINPRAATIAELVLWIGYLQWHHRNRGSTEWPEPVLRKFANIENRDAVLAYDEKRYARDETGAIRYVWNRTTTKVDPVTGRAVPDESAVMPIDEFVNPRPAVWPQADYIVGNPPFLGDKVMKESLGPGYVVALRQAYPEVPESSDFVVYWWHKASEEILQERTNRFGLITTNSIRGSFNRRTIQSALNKGAQIAFAIPDHPWIDSSLCAAVRISMTVATKSSEPENGQLFNVSQETPDDVTGENSVSLTKSVGSILADLSVGTSTDSAQSLTSNEGMSCPGIQLSGQGFVLDRDEAANLSSKTRNSIVKRYVTGRDLVQKMRTQYVIDTFDMTLEDLIREYPDAFQRLNDTVRAERSQNPRDKYRRDWWLHAEQRTVFRRGLVGLPRFIVTSRTARHRTFQFLSDEFLPESKVLLFALSDSALFGVLCSRIHTIFATKAGGWLGVGNDATYNHSKCFDPFPFPDCTEIQKDRIRVLAEELDAHRKRAQADHGLGLTDIYNVLEAVRAGQPLKPKEKAVHDAALVSTLRQLHNDLDAAVAAAYGWPWPLADEEILSRVVALNTQRAAEEAEGHIRWLRPDYQQSLFTAKTAKGKQSVLGLTDADAPAAKKGARKTKTAKLPWPKAAPERSKAINDALAAEPAPVTPAVLAKKFARAQAADVREILQTLTTLGLAHMGDQPDTWLK